MQTVTLLMEAALPLNHPATTPVAVLLVSPTRPPPAIAGAADLPAWCRSVAAALRWLPSVGAAAAAVEELRPEGNPAADQQQQDSENAQQVKHSAQHLAISTLLLASYLSSSILAGVKLPDAAWAARSPALHAECLSSLWQLHTAACRLGHWVAAVSVPPALCMALARPSSLARMLLEMLEAALLLERTAPAAAATEDTR